MIDLVVLGYGAELDAPHGMVTVFIDPKSGKMVFTIMIQQMCPDKDPWRIRSGKPYLR